MTEGSIPPAPPTPVETELSRLQDEWERHHAAGNVDSAAVILAQAAQEYVSQAAGPVGDGLGAGIIPLWGKSPGLNGKNWTELGMGGVGGRGVMTTEAIFEEFRQAGMRGADGIGVICGAGLLVIDVDNWGAVPVAMWEILSTGSVASTRKDVEDRHAHIGWRVGVDDYVQTLAGFDDLGGPKWTAGGVGELRSGRGMIRIWGGGAGTTVAAREPLWFVGLPSAGENLLSRLTAKPAGSSSSVGEFYTSDLFDWLDAHPISKIEEEHGIGHSERNLENQIRFFHQDVEDNGSAKYSAALRISMKLAVDVAAEAVGGREAYDGLLEVYREAGMASGDWDETERVSAYNRMWQYGVEKILAGLFDEKVRYVAENFGSPLVRWREGLPGGEWTMGVDPETGEILGDAGNAGGVTGIDDGEKLASELGVEDPKASGLASIPMSAEAINEDYRRMFPMADDGFMPTEQMLGADFWESRGVLRFIRRWAWTRWGLPDAVLMGLLAGLGAALPSELVLNPSRATPGPLSLFVLGVDDSGAGKSTNQSLAMRLLRELTGEFGPIALGKVIELPLGTAEGVVSKFFVKKDAEDIKKEKDDLREAVAAKDKLSEEERAELEKKGLAELVKYTRRIDGLVILADEAKSLIQLGDLGGVGLLTMLLTAWSSRGGLVSTFKNTADLPQFKPMSYRISMNASIQTELAWNLLSGEQAASGFAQRLLIFPLNKDHVAYRAWQDELLVEWRASGRELPEDLDDARELMVEEQKDAVDLELAGGGGDRAWGMPDWSRVKGLVASTDIEAGELWAMDIAADCGYRQARRADEKVRFEDRAGNPLDAHMVFNQLRLAGLLAVLDCGWQGSARDTVEINREDWDLAGKIIQCTRSNRSWLGRVAEKAEHRVQSHLAKQQAIREAELVLHEDELSEEGFVNDLLQHIRRFHDPAEEAKYKGDICRASCWYNSGQSKKRKERLKFWRSKGYFQMASETDENEPAWFPVSKIPGVVRLRYDVQGGGWPVSAAVWYTQVPVTGSGTGIEIHAEDDPVPPS